MTPETLRKHMRELGLSQLALAERLGITSGALNRMACGHTPVAPYVEAMLQMIRENNALRIASKYQIAPIPEAPLELAVKEKKLELAAKERKKKMTYTVSTVTRDESDQIVTCQIGTFADKLKAMKAAKRAAHTYADCRTYGPTSLAYVGQKITAVITW